MSESNGTTDPNAAGMKRILSLSSANTPKSTLTKAQRAEAEDIARAIVIDECAKVHEWYMAQFPNYMATFIQDALVTYGLIVPPPGADIVPTPDADGAGSDAAAPAATSDGPAVESPLAVASDAERPADSVAPVSVDSPKSGADDGHVEGLPADGLGEDDCACTLADVNENGRCPHGACIMGTPNLAPPAP